VPGLALALVAEAIVQAIGAPLALADGVDQTWSLSNTSAMMVPSEQAELPAGSAQFSLDTLVPAPSENRPLLLRIPLEPEGDAVIISDPALTAALHRAGVASDH
jgi:hypothetical protein